MKIKHIIFDWDGTIADTYPVLSAGYEYAFKMIHKPTLSYDEIKKITSTVQNKDCLEAIFGNDKDKAKHFFYDFIEKNHTKYLQPIPYAEEVLRFCKQNFNCYLITNKQRHFLQDELTKLNFHHFFSNIVAAKDFKKDKPSPIATHAIFNNNIPDSDSILVIGDGIADYQTARSFDSKNKKTLCVIYDPKNKYNYEKPDYKITDLREIITILQP